MNIRIIYQDDYFLVIDKPPGVVVNRGDSVHGETIQDWVENSSLIDFTQFATTHDQVVRQGVAVDGISQIYDPFKEFINRSGIVHRIDKDTTGLLIIARSPDIFEKIKNLFKERLIHKKYIALVHGLLEAEVGNINAAVGRLPWNRERFGILPGGRPALTTFRVIDRITNILGKFSLLEVSPETGRTHQIRIHLKYISHPVVSDNFYAGRKVYRKDLIFCPRLFLHAAKLGFKHPVSGKDINILSKLPTDLEKVLKVLSSPQ